MTSFLQAYRNFFSIDEIQESGKLKGIFLVLVAGFIYSFDLFHYLQPLVEGSGTICPEYFQSCSFLHVFPPLNISWAARIFYALLFSGLMVSLYFGVIGRFVPAHMLLLLLFIFKTIITVFSTADVRVPYEYFHLLPLFIFLFFRNKLQCLRVLLVFLYASSGLSKIHPGWFAGAYFSTYLQGLPLFPDSSIPILTNFVIIMELGGSWLLLAENHRKRLVPLIFYTFLHLYSFAFIASNLAMESLPLLWLLFHGKKDKLEEGKGTFGMILGLLAFFLNLYPHLIPGDEKITFEGRAFSMSMFDGQRYSISTAKIFKRDGTIESRKNHSTTAGSIIKPYNELVRIQRLCSEGVEKIEWSLVTSLNGGPYQEVVNVSDVCELSYSPWGRNSWIQIEGDLKGYPKILAFDAKTPPVIYSSPQYKPAPAVTYLTDLSSVFLPFYYILAFIGPLWFLVKILCTPEA